MKSILNIIKRNKIVFIVIIAIFFAFFSYFIYGIYLKKRIIACNNPGGLPYLAEKCRPVVLSNYKMKDYIKSTDRSPTSKFYEPIVLFGKSSAPQITFFWSATSDASAREFQSKIQAIAALGENASVKILAYQLFDFETKDPVGPGAYLLCSDNYNEYAKIAVDYLTKKDIRRSVVRLEQATGLYSNSYIRTLIANHEIEPQDCTKSDFLLRQLFQVKKSRSLYAAFKQTRLPLYVINESVYGPDDPIVADFLKR